MTLRTEIAKKSPESGGHEWRADAIGVQSRGRWMLRDITATCAPGELVTVCAIPDPDRALLCLALSGRLALTEGTVVFGGPPARSVSAVGWLPGMRLFEDRATCREILTQAARHGRHRDRRELAASLLDWSGLADDAHTAAVDLTTAQKTLLGAAAAYALSPAFVFLDVPPATAEEHERLLALIGRLRDIDAGVVATHHEPLPDSTGIVPLPLASRRGEERKAPA